MARDRCKNCKKVIYRTKPFQQWKHVPTWYKSNCDDPKPFILPDCTCKDLHGHCYVVECNCERHKYEIN
jgi:cell wall assembly regulator SMI1